MSVLLNDISPKELFHKQKEAFKNKDNNLVKEKAQIARGRLMVTEVGNWEEAKKIVDTMVFPDNTVGGELDKGEKHGNHRLESYEIYLQPVLGYKLIGYYNRCNECEIAGIRNKYFLLLNKKDNCCYQKYFIQKGKYL